MLPYNSRYSGIFNRAPNIKSGETYKKYTLLGKMSTGHPDSPIAEILMPITGKLLLLCDDWAEIKKGDVFVEIEIIPE